MLYCHHLWVDHWLKWLECGIALGDEAMWPLLRGQKIGTPELTPEPRKGSLTTLGRNVKGRMLSCLMLGDVVIWIDV